MFVKRRMEIREETSKEIFNFLDIESIIMFLQT